MAVAVALLVLVVSLVVLALCVRRLWHQLTAFLGVLDGATERLAAATAELEALAPRDDGLG